MQFLCKCVFFKHIIGVYRKLRSLQIRPRDPHNTNQKTMWGISHFHNLFTAMASDVTHISKILMSELDRKTRKQMTVIFKIPFTNLKTYPSCLKLCEILLERWDFTDTWFDTYLLEDTSSEVSILAFQR